MPRPQRLSEQQRQEVLAAARKRRELSQKRLATRFGVSIDTIRRIERSESKEQ
jgi:transcriptional regulator with XRE-family HTH domain